MEINHGEKHINELERTIHLAVQQLIDTQHSDGFWSDCFDIGSMSDAQTLIYLYLLGVEDPEWTNRLVKRILEVQRNDGTWGIHPNDEGDLSTSVECYYALQLYRVRERHPERQISAREFILRHGGLRGCRNLTKIVLAIGGEIPWSWLPSPKLYLLLFFKWSPIRIWDIVTFTRLHIAPMLILASLQYVSEKSTEPVLGDLLINARRWRNARKATKYSGRARADLARCLKWIVDHRENDGTAGSYHSSTFLVICVLRALGYRNEDSNIQSMLQAMRRACYEDPITHSCHQQTCDAHVWNTALAAQALLATGVDKRAVPIQKAVHYLISKQHTTIGERKNHPNQPGGWAFSSNNNIHPDTDDTVACLDALFPYRSRYESSWRRGVNWLLEMQNRDGGWSAFERDANKRWLEWIPANDMKRAMSDPSTPDITARVLEFLVLRRVLPRDNERIRMAVKWLRTHQRADGSWYGRWGTTYIYGTWCTMKALVAVGISEQDQAIRKAKEWLLEIQRTDGSFGESCTSDIKGTYVPLAHGSPTQTAWSLDALIHLYEIEEIASEQERLWRACKHAAEWLLMNAHKGIWNEIVPTGTAFPGALHIQYHIYPRVWPVIALSHYHTFTRFRSVEGG